MLKTLAYVLLISSLLISISATYDEVARCNCDDEDSFWGIDTILEFQKVSDFLISVAYFSIPLELLYFLSFSTAPFRWVLAEFMAFIVLCGLSHLLNGLPFGSHPFHHMVALTVVKILTAVVSCATTLTLVTFIPLYMKVKFREFFLRKKTQDLGREVGIMMRQRETGLHVRMLTREIRKTLDRHTILYTTLDRLSQILDLQNCAVWMPNIYRTEMHLTHELKGRKHSYLSNLSILTSDPDVARIKESDEVNILKPDSVLASASIGESGKPGPVAAIRMPILRVRDFKGGTPEHIQACYAILVLVLPGGELRYWGTRELEIVKVVADQVAVALSHAAILEESQLMREKLVEQNRALQQAKNSAMMASHARNSFQKVMNNGMRMPMHSISGLLSVMKDDNLSNEQRILADAMVKTSIVLSTLISDIMDIPMKDNELFALEMNCFRLHSMIKEAACIAKCLCFYKGFQFAVEVDKFLPDHVIGDEKRVFQLILHMVGNLLNGNHGGGFMLFRIFSEGGNRGRNDQRWANWRPGLSDGDIYIKFEIMIESTGFQSEGSSSTLQVGDRRYTSDGSEEGLSFSVYEKLVQLMQGNLWTIPDSQGLAQSMELVLRFQLRPSISISISETGESSEQTHSNSIFKGMQVLLADDDDMNRAVTRTLLEKLGCTVSAVSSGSECLSAISPPSSFQIVLLELHMPELDGFEVALRIRKLRSRSWPLIIALTANADEDLLEKCLKVGMTGVIRKPILIQGIANELRKFLLKANKIV